MATGTGYYLKQGLDKGEDFMDRKMNYMKENIDKVQEAIGQKGQGQALRWCDICSLLGHRT